VPHENKPQLHEDKPQPLSRSTSITKSLTRRQSLIAGAARWDQGQREEWGDENHWAGIAAGALPTSGLFSRLTLVKAPAEKSGLKQ
jgi:hypothetical protein